MELVASSIHLVSTRETKTVRVNIKTKPSLRLEFRAASILKDDSMSNLINHFMRQCVKELKASDPVKFEEALETAREEEAREAEKAKRLPKAKPMPIYLANNTRYSSDVADETGVDIHTVINILSNITEGIEPHVVKLVLDAARIKTDDSKVSSIKLANGNR